MDNRYSQSDLPPLPDSRVPSAMVLNDGHSLPAPDLPSDHRRASHQSLYQSHQQGLDVPHPMPSSPSHRASTHSLAGMPASIAMSYPTELAPPPPPLPPLPPSPMMPPPGFAYYCDVPPVPAGYPYAAYPPTTAMPSVSPMLPYPSVHPGPAPSPPLPPSLPYPAMPSPQSYPLPPPLPLPERAYSPPAPPVTVSDLPPRPPGHATSLSSVTALPITSPVPVTLGSQTSLAGSSSRRPAALSVQTSAVSLGVSEPDDLLHLPASSPLVSSSPVSILRPLSSNQVTLLESAGSSVVGSGSFDSLVAISARTGSLPVVTALDDVEDEPAPAPAPLPVVERVQSAGTAAASPLRGEARVLDLQRPRSAPPASAASRTVWSDSDDDDDGARGGGEADDVVAPIDLADDVGVSVLDDSDDSDTDVPAPVRPAARLSNPALGPARPRASTTSVAMHAQGSASGSQLAAPRSANNSQGNLMTRAGHSVASHGHLPPPLQTSQNSSTSRPALEVQDATLPHHPGSPGDPMSAVTMVGGSPTSGLLGASNNSGDFGRARSSTVASRISAYNMKFRAESAPSAKRGGTIRKESRASSSIAAAQAAVAAALGPTPASPVDEVPPTSFRDGGAGERVPLAGDYDSQKRTDTVRTAGGGVMGRSEHYKSVRSLRSKRESLKSQGNIMAAATMAGGDDGEDGGASPMDRKRAKRLQIKNFRANLNAWGLFVNKLRKRVAVFTNNNRDGILRLFADSLKLIEGRFGTGIASYFNLSKTIFIMNSILASLWLGVVIVIGMFSLGDTYVDSAGKRHAGKTWGDYIASTFTPGFDTVQTFFAGTGLWETTPLYYKALSPIMLGGTYRMDLAYVFAMFASILVSFALILRRMRAEYVRKSGLTTGVGHDDVYPFSVVAFSSWNHAVESNEMRLNQVYAISTAFKTLISDAELEARKTALTVAAAVQLFLLRTATNVLCVLLLTGTGYVIWDSVSSCYSTTNTFFFNLVDVFTMNSSPDKVRCTSASMATPFPPYVVSISNSVLPVVFYYVAQFERYTDPQWETRMTLARSYLIKIASIYLMLFSLYSLVDNPTEPCWEHQVAKRFLNLLWLDLLLSSLSTVISALLTKLIYGSYEFDITSNILELVYRQAIVWIGCVYAPILAAFSMITTTIIFYVKRFTVLQFAQPPRRIYNSYTQVIVFLGFMLLTLLLMAVPILFAMTWLKPSTRCGPYRVFPGSTITYGANEGAYTVIPKSISQMRDDAARGALNLIGSIVVIGPILAAFALWVYFLLAVARKRNHRLSELEREIKEEREDKRNLIRFYGVKT
ncbi:Transmembrane channel-like [Blastocladiella emersonii ATCC 22665]|nr:Transmembrane channel-like [Blastocladiella emersonii ATCC 22665]